MSSPLHHTFVSIKFGETDVAIPPFYRWGGWKFKGKVASGHAQLGNGGGGFQLGVPHPKAVFSNVLASIPPCAPVTVCVPSFSLQADSAPAISSCAIPSTRAQLISVKILSLNHLFIILRTPTVCQSLPCVLRVQQ